MSEILVLGSSASAGGKDSTLVASLVFDAILSVPREQRTKPVSILCTDTRVEIPASAEGVESTLERMRRCSACGQWPDPKSATAKKAQENSQLDPVARTHQLILRA